MKVPSKIGFEHLTLIDEQTGERHVGIEDKVFLLAAKINEILDYLKAKENE